MKTLNRSVTAVTTAVLFSAALLTTVYAGPASAAQPCAAYPSSRCAELGIVCLPQPPKYLSWICVQR